MKVLDRRVDWLTLAYRVTLDASFTDALTRRAMVAQKHSRAAFYWRPIVVTGRSDAEHGREERTLRAREDDLARELGFQGATSATLAPWGELRYSRARKCWHITSHDAYQLRVDALAPGAEDVEIGGTTVRQGGWTIEVTFAAQWLAEFGLLEALRKGEAMAALCGTVHETRLRRIDLCADVEGWEIGEEDVRRLVKRPRARWQKEYGGTVAVDAAGEIELLKKKKSGRVSKTEREEEERAQDYGRGALDRRQITGLSVGRGGALMSRIYDKRIELERDEERRVNEERRWTDKGWDGRSRVTRVEFQIRNVAVHELGIRDPWRVKDVEWGTSKHGRRVVVARKDAVRIDEDGEVHHLGLVDRLDAIWQTCLDWVRLVEPAYRDDGEMLPAGRLADDERWALLRDVRFDETCKPSKIKRVRVRTAASAAQLVGVAISRAARDGDLSPMGEESAALFDDDVAAREVSLYVGRLMVSQAVTVIEDLYRRFGGPVGAYEHLAVRNDAAIARNAARFAAEREEPPVSEVRMRDVVIERELEEPSFFQTALGF